MVHHQHICGRMMGSTHEIRQGEGGEQGDPLMPLLFSLEQHRALVVVQARLRKGNGCSPFWRPGRGCPQDFTGGIVEAREDSSPPREDEDVESERHHTCRSRRTHSISAGVVVWRGNHAPPTSAQGFKVLGVPIGHPDFVEEFLAKKTR